VLNKMLMLNRRVLKLAVGLLFIFLSILTVPSMATADSFDWKGYTFTGTLTANEYIDSFGNLVTTQGTFGNHVWFTAGFDMPLGETWSFETTFIDYGTGSPRIMVVGERAGVGSGGQDDVSFTNGAMSFSHGNLSPAYTYGGRYYRETWGTNRLQTLLGARDSDPSGTGHTVKVTRTALGEVDYYFDDMLFWSITRDTQFGDFNQLTNLTSIGLINGYFTDFKITGPEDANATPEPGSLLLFGSAMAGLAFWSRRRKLKRVG
jgi:hypothetical protein